MKLCILVAYKFLIKLNFGVFQCISGHVILQNMKFIKLAILKDRDFWCGPKNSIKLFAEHCNTLGGHQVHFWSRDWAFTIFL